MLYVVVLTNHQKVCGLNTPSNTWKRISSKAKTLESLVLTVYLVSIERWQERKKKIFFVFSS